ncbi:MAG: RpiB/LacA/LacB family sugar-phosphate isomerase, partial [Calditrichaeota bacterium]
MKTLVTERDVLDAWQSHKRRLLLSPNAVVTPAAQEAAKSHQIELVRQTSTSEPKAVRAGEKPASRIVVMGADHGGFELKELLKEHVSALGYQVEDVGTYSPESVDYPDFAHAVAERVARNSGSRGIIIDGAGVGSAMVANKVPGIRAATCHDVYT